MAESKRGNGEGGKPRQRPDGRWEARYTDASGKRRSVYGATRKEVAGKLIEALAGKDEPTPFMPTDTTVREFLAQYDDVAQDTMKRRSFETYRSIARTHLLPAFGSTKLKDLHREQIQRMYSRKRKAGLSAARVKRIHGALSAALNMAVKWRYLEHNVCFKPPVLSTLAIASISDSFKSPALSGLVRYGAYNNFKSPVLSSLVRDSIYKSYKPPILSPLVRASIYKNFKNSD